MRFVVVSVVIVVIIKSLVKIWSAVAEIYLLLLQGGTRPIFLDETETGKLDLSKLTMRPRPRNGGC